MQATLTHANHRHRSVFWQGMRVRWWPYTASNPDNTIKVRSGKTHVPSVRPVSTRSFHRVIDGKCTPVNAIVAYFDRKWVRDDDFTLNWTRILASKSSTGIQTYFLFVQGQRDRSINSTIRDERTPTIVIVVHCFWEWGRDYGIALDRTAAAKSNT